MQKSRIRQQYPKKQYSSGRVDAMWHFAGFHSLVFLTAVGTVCTSNIGMPDVILFSNFTLYMYLLAKSYILDHTGYIQKNKTALKSHKT